MPQPAKDRTIPIHIDRQMFKVEPGAMTGVQLRELPEPPIGQDRELFRVVPGGDDVVVGDNDTVELHPGQHFVTAPRHVTPG
jgi:hypothetical protein